MQIKLRQQKKLFNAQSLKLSEAEIFSKMKMLMLRAYARKRRDKYKKEFRQRGNSDTVKARHPKLGIMKN